MEKTTIALTLENGARVEYPAEAWVAAILLELPAALRGRVIVRAQRYVEGALVGGKAGDRVGRVS